MALSNVNKCALETLSEKSQTMEMVKDSQNDLMDVSEEKWSSYRYITYYPPSHELLRNLKNCYIKFTQHWIEV